MAKEKDVLKDTILNFQYPYEDGDCLVFEEYIIRNQLCIFVVQEYKNGVYEKRYEKITAKGLLRPSIKLVRSFQKGLSVYEKLLNVWVFDRKKERSHIVYYNCKPVHISKEINLPDALFELIHEFLRKEEYETEYAVRYEVGGELCCFPELKNFFDSYEYSKATKMPAIKINKEGVWFTYNDDDKTPVWIPLSHDYSPIANILHLFF